MRFLVPLVALALLTARADAVEPVRIGIARLTHDHVFWLLDRPADRGDIRIVGVYEPNAELATRIAERFDLDPATVFPTLDEMLARAEPDAVCHFGSIREHRDDAVRCAEAGVDIMVEKPLALTHADAAAMAAAAAEAGTHLLTNYETTWYASNDALRRRLDDGGFGAVRRMVFRTGHRGPIEIGCRPEFLAWLLDPAENGGGAITDFGCYGVNLATWLMDGRPPTAVSATVRTLKPDRYRRVDDDATIVLEYPGAVAVVQPSWNWPHDVKDAAIACENGDLATIGADGLRTHLRGQAPAVASGLRRDPASHDDPFAHLAAVVRGETAPNALSSVETNLTVMRVLDAARESARTGKRILLIAE